jgi:hypothetical protein
MTRRKLEVALVPEELDQVIPDMERDGGRFERISPADAGELLRSALAVSTDPTLPWLRTAATRDDSLAAMMPLAVRRMAMPGEWSPRGVAPADRSRVARAAAPGAG